MSRRNSRELVFKMLFPINFKIEKEYKVELEQEFESVFDNEVLSEEDKQYIMVKYNNILSHKEELFKIIEPKLNGFSIDKVYKPDLVALLIAVYEIKYEEDIPAKVSVNEALELCKKYSTDKSAGFVNGVLASILKEINNG